MTFDDDDKRHDRELQQIALEVLSEKKEYWNSD
jgi:hypothetical protein